MYALNWAINNQCFYLKDGFLKTIRIEPFCLVNFNTIWEIKKGRTNNLLLNEDHFLVFFTPVAAALNSFVLFFFVCVCIYSVILAFFSFISLTRSQYSVRFFSHNFVLFESLFVCVCSTLLPRRYSLQVQFIVHIAFFFRVPSSLSYNVCKYRLPSARYFCFFSCITCN